jgi:hypothetical protein
MVTVALRDCSRETRKEVRWSGSFKLASAAAPEMVLKRTPSVTISACVLTNTRSCLPFIKVCGLNQIKEGSEPPRHENGENLCVR